MKILLTFLLIMLSTILYAEKPNVAVGNGYAIVTFVAPIFDGGSPIVGYVVTSNPPGGLDMDVMTTKLSHTIINLTNGVSYTFTVTAVNSAGTSPPSVPSNAVIPVDGPPICTPTSYGMAEILVTSPSAMGNQWWFSTINNYNSGSKIIGATLQTYKTTKSGYYWCVITVPGCPTVRTRKIQRF